MTASMFYTLMPSFTLFSANKKSEHYRLVAVHKDFVIQNLVNGT